MVDQPVISKKLMQEWAKAKSIGPVDAFRQGQKAKAFGAVSQAQIAAAWADLLKNLYPKLDQGLQAAVKKANSTKDDALAAVALRQVSSICMKYDSVVEKWASKSEAHRIVAGLINSRLRDIHVAADQAEGKIQNAPRNRP